MGIWRRSGLGEERRFRDRGDLKAANDWQLAAAAALDGPSRALSIDDVMSAFAGTSVKWPRRRERNVLANGYCQEKRRMVIGSRPDVGAGGRAARRGAARKDVLDHACAQRTDAAVGKIEVY
jgi:hypothetical protein